MSNLQTPFTKAKTLLCILPRWNKSNEFHQLRFKRVAFQEIPMGNFPEIFARNTMHQSLVTSLKWSNFDKQLTSLIFCQIFYKEISSLNATFQDLKCLKWYFYNETFALNITICLQYFLLYSFIEMKQKIRFSCRPIFEVFFAMFRQSSLATLAFFAHLQAMMLLRFTL